MPHILAVLMGVILLAFIVLEAFETIILPRTAARELRLIRLTGRIGWAVWSYCAQRMRSSSRRESFLSYFAPMQMPIVLGIWASGLICGFGLILWGIQAPITGPVPYPSIGNYLYLSGTSFFTLGYGDLTPTRSLGRFFCVIESGFGVGFLAIVICYFPVLYGAFSRREVSISLLDARAGTPPAAAEFLRRHSARDDVAAIPEVLREWEQWSAELLEAHLSYPVIAMYRSQHDRESWLAALTMVMDVCSLILVGVDGIPDGQAKLTFAMARHAAIDTGLVFNVTPIQPENDRLPAADYTSLQNTLSEAGIPLRDGVHAEQRLRDYRQLYEPYVNALSRRFLMELPPWTALPDAVDNWQTSAWNRETKGELHF